ncbi:monoglyceride lipase [[Candida] anglica]|uniref:Monoglyceride lipase n=1 Tax=[Candida] anglica TaxID=148631 RepID=A0ABP0E9R7_9ASCO
MEVKSDVPLPFRMKDSSRLVQETVEGPDGIQFNTITVEPATTGKEQRPPCRGKVLFVHGWCEHVGMYYRIMETLADQGFECHAFDQRGSGKTSLGKYRGRVGRTKEVIYRDLDSMIEHFFFNSSSEEGEKQDSHILVGHSMGGGIALNYAVHGKYRNELTHVITTGPLVSVHASVLPSPWFVYLLGTVASWFPNMTYSTCNGPTTTTSSPYWKEYLGTELLCQGLGTLGQLSNMLSRGHDLLHGDISTINPNVKLLVLHAEHDNYTCIKASEQFVNRVDLKHKEFHKVEGACHSLFIESDPIYNKVSEKINVFLADV